MQQRTIAVVGAGISGLGAAWLLSRRHDVTVFERNGYLGGHSNTVDIETPDGRRAIDTGFIVFNRASYPNLVALFDHLSVESAETTMSFAVSLDCGRYEYSGEGLFGLFGQPSNIVSPRHWRMLADTLRFFRTAGAARRGDLDPNLTLGDWLTARGFSRAFIDRHILPIGAAIWSATKTEILSFPALAFMRFFEHHGLLEVKKQRWRTVRGGSRAYVRKLTQDSRCRFATSSAVVRVQRDKEMVAVTTADGETRRFDDCVLACHADAALTMLGDADADERRLLGAFRYSDNEALLHCDEGWMPRRRRLWASWNYLSAGAAGPLCVSYWMNSLQHLETRRNYFVTLNAPSPMDPRLMIGRFFYRHPIFDSGALTAQRHLWQLQGRRRTWFCGSYFGYGFHEDGLQAGLAVAEAIGGVRRPWSALNESGRIHMHANSKPADATILAAE